MHKVPKWSGTKNEAREKPDTHSRVSPSGGGGEDLPPPAKILTNPPSPNVCPSPLMSPST